MVIGCIAAGRRHGLGCLVRATRTRIAFPRLLRDLVTDPSLPRLLQLCVVLPVFNRAVTVCPTLEAVAGQTLLPALLVVVDDGSTDGTADAVEQWIATRQPGFPCRVIRQENRGASAARNVGLEACGDVDLVAYLDSDDLWPADFLERASAALAANPEAVAATADRQYQSSRRSRPVQSGEGLASNAARWLLEHDAGVASATVCRVTDARACGGFPEHLRTGADIAIFMRMAMRGPWVHLPGLPVRYRWHDARPEGEAGHLSETYVDRGRIWAGIFQGLLEEFGARPDFPRDLCIEAVGCQAWLAHRELTEAGRGAEGNAALDDAASLRFPEPVTVSVVISPGIGGGSTDQTVDIACRIGAEIAGLRQRRETLYGILRRLMVPVEVVIVCDAADSDLHTLELRLRQAQAAADGVMTVRLVRAAGLKYFGMKNRGVAMSNGDYVVLLDNNGLVDDTWLERLLASFDNPKVRVVGGHAAPHPGSVYGAALAAAVPMPVPVDSARVDVTTHVCAGNLAAQRVVLIEHPFDTEVADSPERCSDLVLRLGETGFLPHMNRLARVAFPPPDHVAGFFGRAASHARADVRIGRSDRAMSALWRTAASGFVRGCARVIRYRHALGLRWPTVPVAITVLFVHYAAYAAASLRPR